MEPWRLCQILDIPVVWHSKSCGGGPLIPNDGERQTLVTTGNAYKVKHPLKNPFMQKCQMYEAFLGNDPCAD